MTNKIEITLSRELLGFALGYKRHGYKNYTEQVADKMHAQSQIATLLASHGAEPLGVEPTLREHFKQCAEVVKTWPESKRDCLGKVEPVVEGQGGSALMKIAANLAARNPLRQLYLVCEHQGRINTDSLHEHLDKCGDLLAGIALDIRQVITAPPELAELQATIAQLTAENERLKEVTNFKDAVACVFDMLKYTAANTSSKEWDDQLEDLAEDVIEFAPEYKKQWKDIGALSAEIERLKGGQGEPAYWADAYDNTITAKHKSYNEKLGGAPLMVVERYTNPLYTSQPAPVSVVTKPVIWRIPISGDWFYGTKEQCEREYAEYTADFTAEDFDEDGPTQPEPLGCLDKAKELNK